MVLTLIGSIFLPHLFKYSFFIIFYSLFLSLFLSVTFFSLNQDQPTKWTNSRSFFSTKQTHCHPRPPYHNPAIVTTKYPLPSHLACSQIPIAHPPWSQPIITRSTHWDPPHPPPQTHPKNHHKQSQNHCNPPPTTTNTHNQPPQTPITHCNSEFFFFLNRHKIFWGKGGEKRSWNENGDKAEDEIGKRFFGVRNNNI